MYKYKAFISYRHIPFDSYIAEKLLKLIETYKKPHNISQDKRKEYWKCFRDEEEIPISSDIGKEIHNALENSEYLIVVCSPELLKSEWCLEEISYFKKIHGGSTDNIIAVLIDGKPETAFPASLTSTIIDGEECAVEPLAAEIKGNSVKDSLKKLKTKYLKIVARFLDCEYDDLIQRENRRKRKKLILFSCIAIAVLTVIIIIISISFATVSNKNKTISQQYNELEEKNKLIDEQYSSIRHEYADNLISSAKTQYDNGLLMEAKENCNEALGYLDENDDLNYDVEYILSKINGTYDEFKFYPYCKLSHDNNVQLSEFVGNGETLFTSDGNNIYFWNTENGELRNRYSHTELGIENNAYFYFDKDGTDVYSMYGKALIKFDGLTGNIVYTYEDYARDVYINDKIVAMLGSYAYTGKAEDYFINIYDADFLELVKTLSFSQDFLQNENTNGNFAVEYHKPIIYSPNSLRVMYYDDETIIFVSLDSKLMAAKIIDNVIQPVSLVCNFEYEDYQFFGNTFNNVFNMKYDLLVDNDVAFIFYNNEFKEYIATAIDLKSLNIISVHTVPYEIDLHLNPYPNSKLDIIESIGNNIFIGKENICYIFCKDYSKSIIPISQNPKRFSLNISDYYIENDTIRILLTNGSELVLKSNYIVNEFSRKEYNDVLFTTINGNKYVMQPNAKNIIYIFKEEKNPNYSKIFNLQINEQTDEIKLLNTKDNRIIYDDMHGRLMLYNIEDNEYVVISDVSEYETNLEKQVYVSAEFIDDTHILYSLDYTSPSYNSDNIRKDIHHWLIYDTISEISTVIIEGEHYNPLINSKIIPKFSKDNYVFAYGNPLDGGSVYYINTNGKNNSVHGQSFHAYSADPPSAIIYGYLKDISEYAFQLYNFETDSNMILKNIPVDGSRTDYSFSIINDEIFVLFSSPNKFYIYDMKTGELKNQFELDMNIINIDEIINDGTDKGIYVFSNNKTLHHISLENGKILNSLGVDIYDFRGNHYQIEVFDEIIILSNIRVDENIGKVIDKKSLKLIADVPNYYSYEPKVKKIYTCNNDHSNIGYIKVDEKIK